ncbi:MAG: ribbon-helix-helix domain-containing protein [Candidatus Eisenbacteria bacterium]|nr:ribbon-helix-helix domain-containing protein [Candidatus Eisenbacteria bacterium]
MGKVKIAISISQVVVHRLDQLIRKHIFTNRSQAIEEAVQDKLERMDRGRLARECAKLDPAFEKAMAEEGMSEELGAWPKY